MDPRTSKGYILTRPTLRLGDSHVEVCWRGYADLGEGFVEEDSLEPVLALRERGARWAGRLTP